MKDSFAGLHFHTTGAQRHNASNVISTPLRPFPLFLIVRSFHGRNVHSRLFDNV